ncbi:putative fatty acyl-CoA reductase CG5065 isoform X1 [Anabrus simplex]|uniref:putative fatty acyl-CoA reductase CG5065 isoform X1 n=1 Tax=Anabrus simplex TaxID=316456 RepID=UPI0035A2D701
MSRLTLSDDTLPATTIPEFYAGQDVFVTGATGFVGKLVVEKLLWSCPRIGNIYMLVRRRRGMKPQDRLREFTEHVLFERLRKNRPDDLEKLNIIEGDQMELGLGISSDDRQLLKKRVSVVIHAAASVRFDDPVSKAIICNTRGTREMVHLAMEMEKLKVFVYVSTAYSNTEHAYIEEKVYDPPADWRTMISAAENLDSFQLDVVTKKLIGMKPNSYIFSKALAEAVVNNYKDRLPAVIFRPSVVVATIEEPIPGYSDNFNGPVGLKAANLTGIALVTLADPKVVVNYISADITARGIIISSWRRTHLLSQPMPVYNCCTQDFKPRLTYSILKDMTLSIQREIPISAIYYPLFIATKSMLLFYSCFYLLQLPLAALYDLILPLTGRSIRLVKIQRKFFYATLTLKFFTHNERNFSVMSFNELEKSLHSSDVEDFEFKLTKVDPYLYYRNSIKGLRTFLLKETTTLEQNARLLKILYYVHILLCLTVSWLLYWFCSSYSIPQRLMSLVFFVIRKIFII